MGGNGGGGEIGENMGWEGTIDKKIKSGKLGALNANANQTMFSEPYEKI